MKGTLMIVSGPSGVGKDTLIDRWAAADPTVERVVAYTTRDPRPGEVDGKDYHFVTEAEFAQKERRGDFLESKEVHGRHYATPLKDMEKMLARGLTAILKIDVQGALTVMAQRKDAVTVFVLPPSMEELEDRLRNRRTEPEETVRKRLQTARDEVALADRYDHRIVNDDIDQAVAELARIKEESCRSSS